MFLMAYLFITYDFLFIDLIDRRGYSSVNIVIGVVAVGFFPAATIDTRYSKI